jgi:hypothetical protein
LPQRFFAASGAESVCEDLELEALGMLSEFPKHVEAIKQNVAPRLAGDKKACRTAGGGRADSKS